MPYKINRYLRICLIIKKLKKIIKHKLKMQKEIKFVIKLLPNKKKVSQNVRECYKKKRIFKSKCKKNIDKLILN